MIKGLYILRLPVAEMLLHWHVNGLNIWAVDYLLPVTGICSFITPVVSQPEGMKCCFCGVDGLSDGRDRVSNSHVGIRSSFAAFCNQLLLMIMRQ